jgi:hypothetical protein
MPNTNNLSLHILVEQVDSDCFMASVPELPDCQVLAKTRIAAITDVRDKVRIRLANLEVLQLEIEVANNPWLDFIGMFEGDNEFAEIALELRTERELDINGAT